MAKKIKNYQPDPEIFKHFPELSGNTINGVGESLVRRASPFFSHPKERQKLGKLQDYVLGGFAPYRKLVPEFSEQADIGPDPIEQANNQTELSNEQWTGKIKNFALAHDADLVGITAMNPLYLFEGYEDKFPWVIMLGISHDYKRLSQAPSSPDNLETYAEGKAQYNRGARASAKLRNFILQHGYAAHDYPGPMADAINMIPFAIAAGLGELGKHGSLINKTYGANLRLAAVTTDMPLIEDAAEKFGVDDFCMTCQVCTRECPPDAISSEKLLVRGEKKWQVNFDKCIPYWAETFGCGICIAKCPWSLPDVAPRLAEKMLRRASRKGNSSKE